MKKDNNDHKEYMLAKDIGPGKIVFKDENIELIDTGHRTKDFLSEEDLKEYEDYKKSLLEE